jgi:uncharacterized protein YcfL
MLDRRWLLLVLCAFALSSCSSTEWVHRHKKQEEFLYDYNKCDKEVMERSNTTMITLGDYQQNVQVEQCLQKEGWRKIRR